MDQNYQTPQMDTPQQNNNVGNNGSFNNQMLPKPDNNLVLAIFTTICCCLPFGIVAIVKASSVNTLYLSGNYQAAVNAAAEAKKWSIWGIIAGVVISGIYTVLYAFGVAATIMQS